MSRTAAPPASPPGDPEFAGSRSGAGTRGTRWVGLASALHGVQNVVALVLILKYWMTPAQFGVATLAVSLFPILDALAEAGLASAAVQDARADLSSLFWMNLGVAALLFAFLCAVAPAVAAFDGAPVVAPLLLAYGVKLLLGATHAIPEAILRRELRFRELSIVRIVGNLASFAVKIGCAAAGFPIWSFVAGPLARAVVTAVGVPMIRPFRLSLRCDLRAAWQPVRFGAATTASRLLFFFYTNVDYQVVGHFFGMAALGIYRAAYELVLEPVRFLSDVTTQVAFPAFVRLAGRPAALRAQLAAFTRQNLAIVGPFVALIVVGAGELLELLMPNYRGAATAAKILAGVGALRALSFVLPPLLDGIGAPLVTLAYTAVCAVVLPIAYVVGAIVLGGAIGVESVAVAWGVGYAAAFATLLALALPRIGARLGDYAAPAIELAARIALAGLVGAALREGAAALGGGAGARLVAAAAGIAGALALLGRAAPDPLASAEVSS